LEVREWRGTPEEGRNRLSGKGKKQGADPASVTQKASSGRLDRRQRRRSI
jgi:hypothetical protein